MFTAKRKGILALLISVMAAALLAFGVFFALPSTTASAAEGGTVEVNSEDALKQAIDAAATSGNATIVITEDITLTDTLSISNSVSIKSANSEEKFTISISATGSLSGTGTKPAIVISADGAEVNFENLIIKTDGSSALSGVSVLSGSELNNVTFTNCEVTANNSYAIEVVGASNTISVTNSTLNGWADFYIKGSENDVTVESSVLNAVYSSSGSGNFGAINIYGTMSDPINGVNVALKNSELNVTSYDDALYALKFYAVWDYGTVSFTDTDIALKGSGAVFASSFGDFTVAGGSITSDQQDWRMNTVKSMLKAGNLAEGYALKENEAGNGYEIVEGGVVTYTDSNYEYIFASLQDAINMGANSVTLTLIADVENESVKFKGTDLGVTLDLNGYTITNAEGSHTVTNYGDIEIIDGSENHTGTVDNTSHARGALVNYGTATLLGGTYTRSAEAGKSPDDNGGNSWYVIKNYNNLNIGANNKECNVVVTANGSYSSLIANGYQNANDYNTNFGNGGIENPTLKVYGGSFSGGLNTLKTDEHSKNEIYGGTFSNSAQYAVMNYGETTISGGEFTYDGEGAYGAIYSAYDSNVAVGALEITGGTFDGGENGYGVVAINGAAVSISGEETIVKGAYAVVVNGKTTKLTIEDGTYSGNFFGQNENTLGISGGNFDTMPDAEYFKEGFAAAWDEETGAYVADDVATVGNFVAAIGNKQYTSLQEAVNAVPNNTEEPVTVTLIGEPDSEVKGGGVVVQSGKNIIIDFNNLTYIVNRDAVGSSGTETNAFQLLRDSTVKMIDGTVEAGYDGVKLLIQNYCDLTLENMVVNADSFTKPASNYDYMYAVSNNYGSLTLVGSTQILAEDMVAFDLYYSLNGGYREGVAVYIDKSFSGEIIGKIEYGSSTVEDNTDWMKNVVLDFAEGNTGTFNIELSVHGNYKPLSYADEANINVAGGTFTNVLNPNYIAEGANLYTNGTNYMVAQSVLEDYSEVIALETDANGQYVAGYTTLQDAVNAAQDGNTITLLQNVVLTGSEAITIDKSLTLDLGSYTVSDSTDFSGTAMIIISNGDVTITNGKLESIAAGGESGSVSRAVISLIKSANVTLNEGLNVSSIYTGIAVAGNSTLTTSANISTSSDGWRAIDSNGLNEGYTTINIKGGEVTAANSVAIYHPQNGELNISGGKVSGATALFMRGGELNISGGTIASTYTGKTPSYNLDQSGCGATSDVVVLVNSNGYTDITANITGGAFESAQGEIFLTEAFDNEIVPSKFVSGGNFDKPILGSVIAENSALFTDENGANYQVAASNTTVEGMNLVKVLTATETEEVVTYKGYASWADAYKNIADKVETTVILYTDLTSAITIDANKDIILDLNGFDINVTGGSAIVNNGTLTLRGEGVISSNSNTVKNSGTITIYDVTVNGVTGGYAAALCNVGGTMTIVSGTFTSEKYAALYVEAGNIDISGGIFTSADYAALYAVGGSVKAFGGIFTNEGTSVNNATKGAVAYIQNATLNTNYAQYNSFAKGVYISNGSLMIFASAQFNVMATTEEAYMIYTDGDATVSISGGYFTASNEATKTYFTNDDIATWTVTTGFYNVTTEGRFAAPIPSNFVSNWDINYYSNTYDGVGFIFERTAGNAQITRGGLTYRFATLQAAINAAEEDDTVVLLKDVTENVEIPAGLTITLNLNGKNITNAEAKHTIANKGTLTIIGEGVVDNTSNACGAFVNYGTATLLGGTYTRSKEAGTENANGNSWYVIKNYNTLTIGEEDEECGVTVEAIGSFSSLMANGYQNQSDYNNGKAGGGIEYPVLVINGGTFKGGLNTLKNDTNGIATLNGGDYGNTSQAVILNWNTLEINGGTYTATEEAQTAVMTGDDTSIETDVTTINGGTFKGNITYYYNPNYPEYGTSPDYSIAGGDFDTAVAPEYVAEDTYFYPTTDNKFIASATKPTADETTGVAMIEGGKYIFATLQAAIDASEDGDTIVLVNDVAESVNVPAGLTLTLDLNGKNVTNTEGQNTITNKGTLTIIGEGVVDNTSNQKAALYNYGTMYVYGGSYTRSLETGANPSEGGANTYYNIKNLGHMTIGENAESKVSVTQSGKYSSLVVNGYYNVNEYNTQIGNVTTEDKVPTLVINGGYYSGGIITVKVDDRGVATINGGTFTNVTQNVVQNNNVLTINGGEFNGDGTAEQTILTRYYDGGINTGYTEITGGTIHGVIATNSSKADYSISGGSFDVKPSEDYFAPGYDAPVLGADGYYTTISVAANIEAQADVKLYAAALGIKWSELTEENAAAVLEAYDAIYSAATAEEIAAAKVAAMAELDEYAENAAAALESYKAEMIAEVEAYAAGTTEGATVVAVPTYVVSAIYGATSTAEIDKYVAVAEAEIDELRAARDEAKAEAEKLDQAMADIDSIISALSIAQGEGGTWTSALLEKIEQLANSANTAAGEIKDLIGTPATEGGNNTLAGMIEEAQNEITNAINNAKAAIVEVLEGADGNGGLKAEIAEVKGVADSLAALFDGEGEGDLAAMLEDISKVVTEVQGNVDKIEADLGVADGSTLAGMIEKLDSADSYLGKAIAGIQTALNAFIESATTEVGAISGKLDELSTAVSKLPTTDNSAAISELKELISTVDGKVDDANDAIDEVSGKVDTISDGVSGALASVNASIGSLAEAQNALKTAVEGYKTAVDNALTSTDTKLAGLAESIEGLAGDNAELKAALELLQQTADDLRDAVDAVDDGNQTDLTAISAAVATLQQSVTELAGNVDAVAGTVNGVAQNNEDTLGGVVGLYTFMAVIVVLLVVVLVIVSLKRKR